MIYSNTHIETTSETNDFEVNDFEDSEDYKSNDSKKFEDKFETKIKVEGATSESDSVIILLESYTMLLNLKKNTDYLLRG